jgi:hypothetical protein
MRGVFYGKRIKLTDLGGPFEIERTFDTLETFAPYKK